MFQKLTIYLFVVVFNTTLFSSTIPNREIIILLETRNLEYAEQSLTEGYDYQKPMGIGAISAFMLIALYQKAAPIVANKSLIKNIIDHQNIFNDFINLDFTILYKKYGHYKKFKTKQSLKDFQINCKYICKSINEINKILKQKIKNNDENHIYQILNEIVANKQFNLKFAPPNIQKLSKDNAIQDLELEMIIYIFCNSINFQKDWDIKQVNEDIFLLVPKNYINSLNLDLLNFKSGSKIQEFTNLEVKLGLKIDHMKHIDRSFFEQPIQAGYKEIPFKKSLEQIFITHSDLKKYNLHKQMKHIWSVYMAGHGNPACLELEVLPQLNKLKNLFQKKLNSSKFKFCLDYENNKFDNLVKDNQHIDNCKHHKSFKDLIDKIQKTTNEIKEVDSLLSQLDNNHIRGIIASLPIEEFRNILHFLNNDIETALFYYTSCFSGGNHLIKPYTENDKPLILKYPIITNTPTDNKTVQELPIINIPPYSQTGISIAFEPSQIHISDIDVENKKLNISVTLDFNRFFSALRKGIHTNKERMLLTCYSLHPHVDQFGKIINQRIASIPLIRPAYTDHFQPIPDDNSSVIINNTNNSKPITINKESTLIYSDYISGKVTLNNLGENQAIPQLFSMASGFALHVFEEIHSTNLNLREIVNSFLTFPELSSPKIFWVKKLSCKNISNQKSETLKDVIIMRKIFNSNTLSKCSNNQFVPLENCAYFSSDANIESKLTWDGPFIENNNFKISPCKQSTHKEECLNFFPYAKNFVSTVLQNI